MKNSRYTGINRIIKSDKLEILLKKINDGTFRDFIDDWKWIFSFSKKYKWVIFFYTVLGILSSSLSLVAAYVSKILINIIVEKQHQNLWILITIMLSSTVFSLVLGSVLSRINTKISIYVNNDIQSSIFDRIVDARWIELNKYSNGDLLNRFSNDVGTVSGNAIGWIPNLIINIYTFIATFVVLFRTDPNMAWIALGSAPFLLIMSKFIMGKMREYKKRVLEMNSQMMSFEVETFYNFDTIKSFGISERYSKKLKWWQGKYKDYNLDYNKFEIKANIMMTLVTTAVSMVAFGYCLFRLWTGQILYGDMTFFLTQRSSLTAKFNALVGTIPGMVTSAISAHRIRELVDLPKEDHDTDSADKISAVQKNGITVTMDNVDFAYTEGKNVYENGNFIARPGEIIAVLGPSGEGKTTMLRLLLGLIKPSSGRITLSGKDGVAVDMNADLRKFFSYVPQGNTIVSGTVADNLRMVKEDATDEELIEVLKLSCAWDFIGEHPQTIYAPIGERGAGLSEGQAQRIAIARALLRDAPILLLDEATSALDNDTEQRVLDNIIKGRPNKTFIISTHRKSVLSQCNRVYFIKNKKAEEFIMKPSKSED